VKVPTCRHVQPDGSRVCPRAIDHEGDHRWWSSKGGVVEWSDAHPVPRLQARDDAVVVREVLGDELWAELVEVGRECQVLGI